MPASSTSPSLLTISLSGPPSAGKSTLLYLLTSIFPTEPLFTLQVDDFCKPFSDLPLRPDNRGLDADSVLSVDFPAFLETLRYCRREGRLPEWHKESWQDRADVQRAREVAMGKVRKEVLEEMRELVKEAYFRNGSDEEIIRGVGIVDGFLLYHSPEIRHELDVKLFLRLSKSSALRRRMGRSGYGDPETKDFWRTEEYFEECVWGNYVKEHARLFEAGDMEGRPDERICEEEGILMEPGIDRSIEETFKWAVKEIVKAMRECG